MPLSVLEDEFQTNDLDAVFDQEGIWRAKPQARKDPFDSMVQSDFLRILEERAARLPPNTAQVFLMRERLGLDTQEILWSRCPVIIWRCSCTEPGYRLGRCLELHWHWAEEGTQ